MAFVRTPLGNPATDSARFLRRLAFIILMIFTAVAELVSHGLIYALFPIGAAVLIIAGLLAGGENAPRRILVALKSPIGIAVLFLAFWSALSLSWTAFPADAAARLGRTLMTAGISFLAILSLPQRTKISNIYLLPIGRRDHGGGRPALGSDRPGIFSPRLYARQRIGAALRHVARRSGLAGDRRACAAPAFHHGGLARHSRRGLGHRRFFANRLGGSDGRRVDLCRGDEPSRARRQNHGDARSQFFFSARRFSRHFSMP